MERFRLLDPIKFGDSGSAVEDVQQRLIDLNYDLGKDQADGVFGEKTAEAVKDFRSKHKMSEEAVVDSQTWHKLVDDSFKLGGRSLYLRYPNFHGADILTLQTALNILGFGAGKQDGIYGIKTEAAVKEFQANVGINPDGIAFQDTFDAIKRLKHVWGDKTAKLTYSAHPSFLRAVSVIERVKIALVGLDPISRNIAGRIWNIAAASSEHAQFYLSSNAKQLEPDTEIVLEIGGEPANPSSGIANVVGDERDSLPARLTTARQSFIDIPAYIRLVLEDANNYDGSFTSADAQHHAVEILDALCRAFDAQY